MVDVATLRALLMSSEGRQHEPTALALPVGRYDRGPSRPEGLSLPGRPRPSRSDAVAEPMRCSA